MRRACTAGLFCAAATVAWSPGAFPPANAATPLASPNLPAADSWVPTGGGSVRVLDKQKAQSQVLGLKVGQTAQFETLQITLRACVVHPPVLPPDAAGFVVVTDSRDGEPGFHGWMLSGEPGAATLESPVYGVRVSGCEPPTDAAVASAMPQAVPPAEPTSPPGGAALPGSGTAAADGGSVPLSPTPSEPLDAAPPNAAPPNATPANATPAAAALLGSGDAPAAAAPGSPAPPGLLAPASPGRPASPASPAAPAAPASGGIY